MQSDTETSALLSSPDTRPREADQSTGARPKIRNPKEAKRRRFVMKQAKTIAKPQLLESVSETEEGSTLLRKPPKSSERSSSEFFGVRSYVHTFYEAMAMDDRDQGFESSIVPARKRRKLVILYRLMLGFGALVLALGLVSILVGYLAPRRPEVVDVQEDIEVISRENQAYNRELGVCKVVGLALFCAGGLLVTGVLVAMIVLRKRQVEALYSEDIPLADVEDTEESGPPASPMDVKVPATEELTAVQPKRENPEELVMTNAGLCKVP